MSPRAKPIATFLGGLLLLATPTYASAEEEVAPSPEAPAEVGAPPAPETPAEPETKAESTNEPETLAETTSEPEPLAETEAETAPETEAETAPETEPEAEPEAETETEAETEAETEPEPEAAPETETETAAVDAPAPVGVAVLDLASKGGIDQDKVDALGDMIANLIRGAGVERVIGSADIKATLEFEAQRTLLGCNDDSCVAELGGALGVRYVVLGNVTVFGKTFLLNLKLLNVQRVEVARGVSRTITGGEDQLVAALPEAVNELLTGVSDLGAGEVTGPTAVGSGDGGGSKPGLYAGTFPIIFMLTTSAGMPPYATGDNEAQKAQLVDLQEVYLTASFEIFVGYAIRRWVTIGPRVGVILGGDTNGNRWLAGLDAVLEVQFNLNIEDSDLRPTFYVAGGTGHAWDRARGSSTVDFDSNLLRLEIGIGVEYPLTERWFFGGRLAAHETGMVTLHNSTDLRLDPSLWTTSISLQAMIGYRWAGLGGDEADE